MHAPTLIRQNSEPSCYSNFFFSMAPSSPRENIDVPESGKPEKSSNGAAEDHEEQISKLPRNNGWISIPHCAGELYQYQGFWHSRHFLESIILAQRQFVANPSDIVVCSAPKTGTTWLKALAFAIMSRKVFDDSTSPLLSNVPHECLFFLEVDIVKSLRNEFNAFPLLGTHIPYTSLLESIVSSGCKIIYICREPKDAFVSLWHFWGKLFREFGFLPLEEAFEHFCEGISLFGPYWDHVLGYWKASLETPDKVLFLKYEDMRRDTRSYVKILAEFMGQPFSEEEERNGAVERIVRLCSFENLSNLEVNKNGRHHPAVPNHVFFRKGKVGDWENHLTTEMKERLDRITEQKLKGSGFTFGSK